jgi:hypothetical protein
VSPLDVEISSPDREAGVKQVQGLGSEEIYRNRFGNDVLLRAYPVHVCAGGLDSRMNFGRAVMRDI